MKNQKLHGLLESETEREGEAVLYAARYTIEAPTRREELAHQRALAEKLLAYSLKREHGLELPSLAQSRTAAGKPYFPGCPVEYSLSHCRGLVCCALSLSPVGVDAEAPRTFSPALLRRVCTQEELSWLTAQQDQQQAFLSLWTLKESVMKLSGQGIGYGFQRASFTFPEGQPRFREPGVRLSQFVLEGGTVVSAAGGEVFPSLQLVELAL